MMMNYKTFEVVELNSHLDPDNVTIMFNSINFFTSEKTKTYGEIIVFNLTDIWNLEVCGTPDDILNHMKMIKLTTVESYASSSKMVWVNPEKIMIFYSGIDGLYEKKISTALRFKGSPTIELLVKETPEEIMHMLDNHLPKNFSTHGIIHF